jgi:hypothetical protein
MKVITVYQHQLQIESAFDNPTSWDGIFQCGELNQRGFVLQDCS